MEKNSNKPKLKEPNSPLDLVRMRTGVALLDSMLESKTLTIIVIIGVLVFAGFFNFLYKMATG